VKEYKDTLGIINEIPGECIDTRNRIKACREFLFRKLQEQEKGTSDKKVPMENCDGQ
jgi:hypothetical protein